MKTARIPDGNRAVIDFYKESSGKDLSQTGSGIFIDRNG